jgi:hypothetical protein
MEYCVCSDVFFLELVLICLILIGFLRSTVIDCVTLGCPCCKVQDCTIPLATVKQHFCPDHKDLEKQCAVTDCTETVNHGFHMCLASTHRQLEVHYYQQGKPMFQLKRQLERLKISQTNDWLSPGSPDESCLNTANETVITGSDLLPNTVRGLPIHFHSSLLPLAFPSTLEPFRSFGVLSGVSGIPGDCLEFPESSETVWSS